MRTMLLATAAIVFVLGAQDAPAMPGMGSGAGGGRFDAADTDKDGRVSREEFNKGFPTMTEAAFKAIDADSDGAISREEWDAFMRRHSMGKAGGPREGAPSGDTAAHGDRLPLVTPPSK